MKLSKEIIEAEIEEVLETEGEALKKYTGISYYDDFLAEKLNFKVDGDDLQYITVREALILVQKGAKLKFFKVPRPSRPVITPYNRNLVIPVRETAETSQKETDELEDESVRIEELAKIAKEEAEKLEAAEAEALAAQAEKEAKEAEAAKILAETEAANAEAAKLAADAATAPKVDVKK